MAKSRELKREEAQARQAEHNKLSNKQKITKASQRKGNSKKEIARLKESLK